MIKKELIQLIENRRARVAVIGLGYVGLPLATEFAGRGFQATGFEVDEKKVAEINAGRSYIGDVAAESIKQAVDAGRLRATIDFSELTDCDAIIICVPTPLRKTKEPDVSFILAAAEEIQKHCVAVN
jgi:UDP-N-acetyl-D-glucosamine dehydrogenase